jgi:integrase/recombinase XerD
MRDRTAIGPLEEFEPGYRVELVRKGFCQTAIRHRVSQFRQLSRWMRDEGISVDQLDDRCVARFPESRRTTGRGTWVTRKSLTLPVQYLHAIGAAPASVSPATEPGSIEELLAAYRDYLARERALCPTTVATYVRVARCFCGGMADRHTELAELSSAQLTAFVVQVCERSRQALAKKTVTALSSLLRYLHITGVTTCPLATVLPKVAGHARVMPKPLDADRIEKLLASCGRSTDTGRRDYAMLMLLSRLGLRAGEIAALSLDDIDWRHGEIVVRGKGNRCELLPLPPDVGRAVVDYLRGGGRRVPPGCRAVFVRAHAPEGGVTPSVVANRVAAAARRAGLAEPVGPRALRHSAATAILRRGAGLPEVAQVLRHNSIQVTARYAAVDESAARELARPWPGAR